MKAQYKVEGSTKIFDRLADARKHRKELKASLPDSVVVTIYKSEEIGSQPHELEIKTGGTVQGVAADQDGYIYLVMWVPHA